MPAGRCRASRPVCATSHSASCPAARSRSPGSWSAGRSDGAGMRAFTAAAVQVAPYPGPLTARSIRENVSRCAEFTRRCVDATGAELVVLPETATTGFTPGRTKEELWDLVTELPGPMVEPLQEVARETCAHVCVGTYERGPQRGVVYN